MLALFFCLLSCRLDVFKPESVNKRYAYLATGFHVLEPESVSKSQSNHSHSFIRRSITV